MRSSWLFVSYFALAIARNIPFVPDASTDTSILTRTDAQEPTLPFNLADIPIYKVPYAEHLLDNVKAPEDFKALPPVVFYLHGSKVSTNPWFYYSSRFKGVFAFSQYAIDETFTTSASTDSLSASIPALLPYIPIYLVPHPEELLKDVKTPKDLEALPRVTLYIYGAKAEADPWIYYSSRFKELPAFTDYHHVEKEDSPSNPVPPAASSGPTFGEDGLPTNLDSIPLYKLDYPENLVDNVKTPQDFGNLPQVVFFSNGSKVVVNPWGLHANQFAGLPEFSRYSPTGSIEDPLPARIGQIPWFNASYPMHLIEQATAKEDISKLPDAVVYRYGVPINIPAWKMFMLGDFDVTATQHQRVPVIGRSAGVATPPQPQALSASQLPEQPGYITAPSSKAITLPDPKVKLPDDLESSNFYQAHYKEELLDNINDPQDFPTLPDVIVYVYGRRSAVPAWICYLNRMLGMEWGVVYDDQEDIDNDHTTKYESGLDISLSVNDDGSPQITDHGSDPAYSSLPPNLDERSL
ncbi:hypothetical protein Cpir12675_006459 [Ceratocystis pirilliformis]|uniref:Uncharacterized protein n=1 Tax=Ceratocystis pirilliformis TaxID=259994 RepID=A0ABR3YHM4_9PEZI